MPDKFKNKYTINSTRLQNYDYSQNGMYFVTICTREKEYFFGEMKNGEMNLSDVGKIVHNEWLQTPKIRNNVFLDEWVIMPNHLHGIIEIRNDYIDTPEILQTFEMTQSPVETPRLGVSTIVDVFTNDAKTQNENQRGGYNPNWKPNSLGSIINQFKSVCTKKIRKSNCWYFQWQSRFYDHIIRNDESLNKIREYIIKNPGRWERDKNNVENLWM
ncbi:MAG TPA: transposase [Candidatus Moranbacteria bacterium]|nr:transposase [Candidatus Moranbacteria bacterium]HAT74978.1 transposase [Candidatus Moranbacteria bacterium]